MKRNAIFKSFWINADMATESEEENELGNALHHDRAERSIEMDN